MEKKRFARCFITAPADLNTSTIINLFKKKGISASDFYSLGVSSTSTSVESEIIRANFVVAILSSLYSNQNVLYELGLARGLKKPILIIAIDDCPIPYFLKGNVYLRANLMDSDILSFKIDQFLLKQKNASKKSIVTENPSLKGTPKHTKQYLLHIKNKLKSLSPEATGNEFSNFLGEFFRNQGFVVESSGGSDIGADMSIWVDSLEKTLGNPILVETKYGLISEVRLRQSEMQLREFLAKSNLRSGILVYLDKSGRDFGSSKFTFPLVIRFEVFDLIEKLTKEPLDSLLLKERNKIAHGSDIE